MLLTWAIVAVSLANTILLLWLGLTVLLNAERRTWGMFLIAGGFLTSAAFFISHTAILGHGLTSLDEGMTFWWHLGLGAALILPFVWYVVILWYTGFWENNQSALHQRQEIWFYLDVLMMLGLGWLLIFANPFPSYEQVITLQLSATPTLRGIPLLIIAYPACTALSVCLSLDALRRPGPVRRIMGDIARRRARPWLLATSVVLLMVGVLVAGVMLWVAFMARSDALRGVVGATEISVSILDLIISCLITTAVIFMGQAMICYEVFTGKTLPQRRFMRHWRNVVILAFGYGGLMSASLQTPIHPIYNLLLMALLMTITYALFSQNSYVERERYIRQLRPFTLSQRLYDQIVTGSVPAEINVSMPFHALCRDVLGAQVAYLSALGPLAPLVGPILTYPSNGSTPPLPLFSLAGQLNSPGEICVAVEPAQYGGAAWAVALWSERGLIGVLLLGDKRNGSLYTQEEIEIARTSGERLIDTQASAEMARRLMSLQRQRLTESQVIDRRTRRALHDDILPRLHTAMLTLSMDNGHPAAAAVQLLADLHHEISDLLHEMPTRIAPQVAHLGLIPALRKLPEEEFAGAFEAVQWQVEPLAEREAQVIPLLTAEVLYYAAREGIRNAARHGRGDQTGRALDLTVQINWRGGLEIIVEDDGIGLSDSDPLNAGHGLALHSTMMAVVGGLLSVESMPGRLTRVTLFLPREKIAAG